MRLNNATVYARNQYYIFNSFQGLAVFASAGASALYWAYLLQQSSGSTLITFSFMVGMAIMAVLEGAKFLMQRDQEISKTQFLPFVFFSVLTGLATLMINAELVTAKKTTESAVYQQAKNSSQSAVENKAKYAWAKDLDIAQIETETQRYKEKPALRSNGRSSGLTIGAVLSNPSRYKSYQHYQTGLDKLQKKIDAKRAYDSARISENEALSKMGINSGGAVSLDSINGSFDWFIQSIASLTRLSGLHSLLMIYLFAMILMEIAGAWFGKNAYLYGLEYRKGKEAVRKMIDIGKYGFDPMENMKIINDLTQKLVEYQSEKIQLIKQQTAEPLALEHPQKNEVETEPKKVQLSTLKPPYSAPAFKMLYSRANEPKSEPVQVQSEPKRVQSNEPKKVQNNQSIIDTKPFKRGSRRKTVTPDTGTTGENATRYKALKKAVENGKVRPTKRGIKGFKFGGRGMGDNTASMYRNALIKEGVIS